jgi:RNA polymerase sigma-70 factor (ECF subfamily)
MPDTYTIDQLRTATVPTEAPGTSDAALIQSIAAGDKGAIRIFFARHNVRLFRFLLPFVRVRSVAEDLVSEVFLDVWRQPGRFKGRSEATTWLLAIARNKALSALRHRSREELHEQGPASIENRQKTEILLSGLTQLSTTHREVIDLVYYHQRSIEEVAEIIGVPPSTVKTRMFCARKRIPELSPARGSMIRRAWIH